MTDVYQDHGYSDREAYLESLALDYNVEFEVVEMIADLCGPEEDFDGLVMALCDVDELGY